MKGLSRRFLKFACVVAVVALVVAGLSSMPVVGSSPYVSALATLTTGQAVQAASKCSDRICNTAGTRCVHLSGSHSDCGVGDFCRERACP
jgi:hypothetical protein